MAVGEKASDFPSADQNGKAAPSVALEFATRQLIHRLNEDRIPFFLSSGAEGDGGAVRVDDRRSGKIRL